MKRILLLFLFLTQWCGAQDFSDQWTGFFSFTEIVDIEEAGTDIYVASENAIFIYSTVTQQFITFTTVDGLAGDSITQIHFDEIRNLLIVGYETGLLQLIDVTDNSILNEVAIRDKQIIIPEDKIINEFLQRGGLLYIAAQFGIAIYNLDLMEFDDTYFIGDGGAQLDIQSLTVNGTNIYAATQDGGMRTASITNPFLLDFMNWTQINAGSWVETFSFNGVTYAIANDSFIYRLQSGTFVRTAISFPSRVLDAHVAVDALTVSTQDRIFILNTTLQQELVVQDVGGITYNFTTAITLDGQLYAGTENNGMLRINRTAPTDFSIIVADGPSFNSPFAIDAAPNELWVVYGEYTLTYNPIPFRRIGVSHLVEDAGWTNLSSDQINNIPNISSVTINPDNTDQVVLNSMGNGIVILENEVLTQQFTVGNSTLETIIAGNVNFVRVPASQYDRNGDLWMLNSQRDNALHVSTPAGQFMAVDVSDFIPSISSDPSPTVMQIDDNNRIYFGTVDNGIVGYDPDTDTFGGIMEGIQEGNLITNYVSALEIDLSGQLWIGGNLGLRVLSSAGSMFNDNVSDARSIIIEDTNGVPRELLADEVILDIEVDGNNNKWIATASSGVFLFSPTGRETIFQFTKDNSPLPSDEVRDVAIDTATGRVYFATDKGLVAFQGNRSSLPQDDLENVFAFPNPVRPGFEGSVTIDGLTERARIKVTDVEGNLVHEEVSRGGSVQWDTRSFSGDKVASGVYFLFISTSDNIETTVSKLMIIR